MDRVADMRADYVVLGDLLEGEVDGSKAAALVRQRRIIGQRVGLNPTDLRLDYDHLGRVLASEEDGSKAAAVVVERRQVGELLEAFEKPAEVTKFDELAARRASAAGDSRPASRRRKSG